MPEPVTIVSGLPRSGTSMMMQILEAGGIPALTDHIRAADEDNPKGYYEFEAVKQVAEDASWVPDAEGKVVKMVYKLLYDLPDGHEYRVVFMQRALREVIASQEEMLRRKGLPTGEIDPAMLEAVYRRQLNDIHTWLESRDNFQVLYIDYHDVLEDPDRVVSRLNEFLGGRLDTAGMRRVPDRGLYRQRTA